MLIPLRKIKHNPALTYEKLEAIVRDAIFGINIHTSVQGYRELNLNFSDPTIKTEKLTIDEIKERFPLTPQEEEALRASNDLFIKPDAENNEKRKAEDGRADV